VLAKDEFPPVLKTGTIFYSGKSKTVAFMRIVKKFFLGAMIAAPLLLAPAKSHAGPISDLLNDLFGNDKKPTQNPPGSTGNSVPIDGGLVVLLVAGLGLGAKIIYDNKAKKMETAPL